MPFSGPLYDATIKRMLLISQPDTVLDLGPGAGKYGKIVREVEVELGKHISTTCVEIDKHRIIDTFSLEAIYDSVINDDAANIIKNYPTLTGDVAIMGDFIEHLTKSAGRDLLEFLQCRFQHIFIRVPIDFLSYGWNGHNQESHVSIWLPSDFASLWGTYWVERSVVENGVRVLLCCANGIRVKTEDHFVVRNGVSDDSGIEVGYLNAPHANSLGVDRQISPSTARLEIEVAKLDAERGAAIAELNRIRAECEALRRSTSWRVTRPLRWLRRQLP
jgi:hypothetical protein